MLLRNIHTGVRGHTQQVTKITFGGLSVQFQNGTKENTSALHYEVFVPAESRWIDFEMAMAYGYVEFDSSGNARMTQRGQNVA